MLTKKERKAIYLRAAKLVFVGFGKREYGKISSACCGAIREILWPYTEDPIWQFSEFLMFRNKYVRKDALWWPLDELEPRILALLFAAEMCND